MGLIIDMDEMLCLLSIPLLIMYMVCLGDCIKNFDCVKNLIVSKLVTVLACNWQHRNLTYNKCIWYHDQQDHHSHPPEYT